MGLAVHLPSSLAGTPWVCGEDQRHLRWLLDHLWLLLRHIILLDHVVEVHVSRLEILLLVVVHLHLMVLVVFEYHLVVVEEGIVLLLLGTMLVVLVSRDDHSPLRDSCILRGLEGMAELVVGGVVFDLLLLLRALIAITTRIDIVHSSPIVPSAITQESIGLIRQVPNETASVSAFKRW